MFRFCLDPLDSSANKAIPGFEQLSQTGGFLGAIRQSAVQGGGDSVEGLADALQVNGQMMVVEMLEDSTAHAGDPVLLSVVVLPLTAAIS